MEPTEIIEIEKKGPVLGRPRFGCLAGSFSLNLTRGCACKNPDLPGEPCSGASPASSSVAGPTREQLSLFPG